VSTPEEIEKEIEALLRDNGVSLRRSLRRFGLPEYLVDDVVVDALLAVVDKRRRDQPVLNPRAFLFRVARNAAVDQLKRLHGSEMADSGAIDAAQVPDMIDAAELSEDLSEAISQLPDRQRQVIEFRYLRGFSVAETAQILGIAKGTVGPTTTAAIRNLKQILRSKGRRGKEETR
jgi:RNA polymerase sigma-70 factor (ECF subfamily)